MSQPMRVRASFWHPVTARKTSSLLKNFPDAVTNPDAFNVVGRMVRSPNHAPVSGKFILSRDGKDGDANGAIRN
jgi:hypothetical protein